ncbi:MAG: ABC transporter substrate-binding protein, partial [Oscillospiraceae bacterium]|nr:ABC transporter substrate-binding protein [Oscillospiraceae bacterium]
KQTGIPTIFIEADLDDMAAAYRTLGDILGRQEQAEELAQFIDRTVTMAQTNAAKIPESQRLKVLFGTGSTGLACNAAGSVQADVIDLVGAVNAIIPEEVTNRGGGTTVSLEEVYAVEPDVILLSSGGPYDTLTEGDWAGLTAVQQGRYYEIPGLPYDWMSSPPSVNRVLGIWWLGNLLYPQLYDYDMTAVAQEYYRLFWHYDLSAEEAAGMLSRSTLRT